MPKPRYSLLDLIRGLALVSMMAYHASWDLVYLFGVDWPWYHSEGAFLWQQARRLVSSAVPVPVKPLW